MKMITAGLFGNRHAAEEAINSVHNELNIPKDDVSFIYRNTKGDEVEVNATEVATDTTAEGAGKGAKIGATVGALAGLATVAGVIPVIGPIFAAGPLVTALGIGGALGTTAAGAATGAGVGAVIGALTHLGVGEAKAQKYEDDVRAGNILLVVYHEPGISVSPILERHGGYEVEEFTPTV